MDSFILESDPQFYTTGIILSVFTIHSLLLLILIISLIVLSVKLSKTKKRLKKFLPDDKNIDIESMLVEYNNNVKQFLEKEEKILEKIEDAKNSLSNEIENNKKLIYLTNEKLKNAVQKVSIIRYNPFEEVGGDLCYAIALLDENNNGIVLNSIYSREACYNYAKEIINGESPKHKLSQEEEEALKKAMNK